jgi:hypothetical protein
MHSTLSTFLGQSILSTAEVLAFQTADIAAHAISSTTTKSRHDEEEMSSHGSNGSHSSVSES